MIETDIKKYIRMAFDTQDEGIVDRLSSKAGLETVLRGQSLLSEGELRQIFLAVSMASNQAVENIYYSYPIAWFGSSLLVLVYFLLVKNRMSNRE